MKAYVFTAEDNDTGVNEITNLISIPIGTLPSGTYLIHATVSTISSSSSTSSKRSVYMTLGDRPTIYNDVQNISGGRYSQNLETYINYTNQHKITLTLNPSSLSVRYSNVSIVAIPISPING